jgi:hypothetical protein
MGGYYDDVKGGRNGLLVSTQLFKRTKIQFQPQDAIDELQVFRKSECAQLKDAVQTLDCIQNIQNFTDITARVLSKDVGCFFAMGFSSYSN